MASIQLQLLHQNIAFCYFKNCSHSSLSRPNGNLQHATLWVSKSNEIFRHFHGKSCVWIERAQKISGQEETELINDVKEKQEDF